MCASQRVAFATTGDAPRSPSVSSAASDANGRPGSGRPPPWRGDPPRGGLRAAADAVDASRDPRGEAERGAPRTGDARHGWCAADGAPSRKCTCMAPEGWERKRRG